MLDQADQRVNSLGSVASAGRESAAARLEVLPEAAKLVFRGRPAAIEAAGRAFGLALPQTPCRFATNGLRTAFWLGPDEWMLQALGETGEQLYAPMLAALAGQSCSVVDVSHRSDALALSGLRSAYVLNHGCPLDLSIGAFPVGMCTRTIIGKASILLARPAADTFHIDVWRSFSAYVWKLLDEARSELA
jgi:sarcosine oxidase subunit gamma